MWRRVARHALERRDRLGQPGEDVGLALGVDAGDLRFNVTDVRQRRGADDPVGVLVEGDDAELVALGQRRNGAQDRLLADVDLGHAADRDAVVAVGGVAVTGVHRARLVDHDHQRDVRLALSIAHVHVDRQRFLEWRALVAAGAVRARAADHHQPTAQVASENLQRDHPLSAQPRGGDVGQHDRVE